MKYITFFIFILISFNIAAFDDVKVNCGKSNACIDYTKKLIADFKNEKNIKNVLSKYLLSGDLYNLSFKTELIGKALSLQVNFDLKDLVNDIRFEVNGDIDELDLPKVVGISKGLYVQDISFDNIYRNLLRSLKSKGYTLAVVDIEHEYSDGGIILIFKINLGSYSRISSIDVKSDDEKAESIILKKLKENLYQPYDKLKLKLSIDNIREELYKQGYIFVKISYTTTPYPEDPLRFKLRIRLQLGEQIVIGISGNHYIERGLLLNKVFETVRNLGESFTNEDVKKSIVSMYTAQNIYFSKIEIRRDKRNEQLNKTYLFIDIKEGHKALINEINFTGNKEISTKDLLKLYKKNSSLLATRGFFDKDYIDQFSKIISREYFSKGYILNNVSKPVIKWGEGEVSVEYRIQEGIQSILKKINLSGLDIVERTNILSKIKNVVGRPVNIIAIEQDIKTIEDELKRMGYFFGYLANKTSPKLVSYNTDFRFAEITLEIRSGLKIIFNEFIVSGLKKTKKSTLTRELLVNKGDLVTPGLIQDVDTRITSMGLFSSVDLKPINIKKISETEANADVLIKVQERDSGTFEVAPGFRTDIGLKLSTLVSYSNLGGRGRIVSLKSQANQRLDFKSFDERRQSEKKEKVEYETKVRFIEPWLFNFPVNFSTSASVSRKRFYSFDADVATFDATFAKDFGEIFSSSLTYQLEAIDQTDATEDKDDGYFRIGGLTPSLSIDLRNHKIYPTSGALFKISNEFANPHFLSLDRNDLEINFFKLISRNYFYYPIKNGVLALSLSGGYQKNLSTEKLYESDGSKKFNENDKHQTKGRIPSIKAFRLNGIDTIRGFEDSEANLLISGEDISDIIIQDSAYFSSIKLESRFYMGDDLVLAPFIDGGRVFSESFKPLKVRTSIGLAFKYLTPVGSLDLSYGLKLHRKRIRDALEQPGKFHISIGFF